ncbi:MAG TPA: hypothetical protein PLP61_12900 [Nocardioides sp.]|uniref:hypothetical protein n=1 Tax=Nocardioides sp. TaxID=35761 RepID=UPI002B82E4EA|nr:hypothetical protein [Nocardioides sp.]HQR27930.1 hypothetical protein [Nocardioides sp.]
MLEGVHLTLLVGPVVAVPVPREVLEALTAVEVTEQDEGVGGFSLSFTMSNRSVLPTLFMVAGGSPIPVVRVVLVATLNGTPHVLVDGVVTKTQVAPGSDAGHSTLQVIGEDLTTVMDKIEMTGLAYPAMPGEAIVAVILAKYLALGVVPMIVPSIMLDVPIPTSRIPTQKGTDLEYLQWLAKRVGYVFYLTPGPEPGMSVAYWGPKVKVGVPQPALNVDLDAHTNSDALTFSFDPQNRSLPVVYIQNEQTKVPIPVPIPDIGPLNPPLGLVAPLPTKFHALPETAKYTPVQAVLLGLAEASRSADCVTGRGSLDVQRYGHILQARSLVGVRGVGLAFDGLYYVTQVKHSIKRGEYKQSFSLARNGLVSTVPEVVA